MKPSVRFAFLFMLISTCTLNAQNVSSRTNDFEVDFSDPNRLVSTTIPVINWITPVAETNYSQENKYKIKFEIESTTPLKNITITIKETSEGASRGVQNIEVKESEKLFSTIERSITLMEGENVLEIVAENVDGTKTISQRMVRVGAASIADASKLNRTDYALIIATDEYDYWPDLVNPVFDARTIADELKKTYGFKVEFIENATQSIILKALRDYGEKKYNPLDQLFIFFAGHGTFDQTFGEGFVVTRESLLKDEGKTTYLSHNRLRSIVNNIPAEHIFLAMDVCFGGTFDAALASSRGVDDEVYREQTQSEYITRKLTYKTRRFLTSGGKTYVSDGIPGKHSPFAKNFIEALRARGGRDNILTLPELYSYVEKLKIQPRFGEFGDNAPGSDFVFIAR
ncbi:MAG TPA: caspase family protein [Cyclobacteriaceae bacterium]